jgi:hypothetical protein
MNLNHHQWKLVYDAVRKQQVNSIVDGSSYKEYDVILNELWDAAYSEIYNSLKQEDEL